MLYHPTFSATYWWGNTMKAYRKIHHANSIRKFRRLGRVLPSFLSKSGRQTTAAIIGTVWKKRMMSKNDGSATGTCDTTSQWIQAAWLQAQSESPSVINTQKLRSLPGRARALSSATQLVTSMTASPARSAKAVSPSPLRANTDTPANASVSAAAAANQRYRWN